MSVGGGISEQVVQEFHKRLRIARRMSRKRFLLECIEEKVIPTSVPKQLKFKEDPFSDSVHQYLKKQCEILSDEIDIIRDECDESVMLPSELEDRLRRDTNIQKTKLDRLLKRLCDNSEWNKMGREDLIHNLSQKQLSPTEKQALSLGLKFDTGRSGRKFSDYITKNYRNNDSDTEKGFKQGILFCYNALSENQTYTLPRRYIIALENLKKCDDIVITQADKGGGIVILNKSDYISKMMDLLNDETTYEKKEIGSAKKDAVKFEKDVRRIFKRTDKGQKLRYLIEEAPRPPKMRGLPKVHKAGIPMRPITSGIGSAPHKLAKVLAKPLSKTLGTISGAHLRNSTDLIEKISNIDMRGKKLVSFDVKALFTNVPVEGAMNAVKRAIDNMEDEELPINKRDYLELVSLCVKFGAFTFEGNEFKQHRGLAQGSPLSPVMACLHMEVLEKDRFERIMGRGTSWYRYVDDVITVIPSNTNVRNKLRMLNEVDSNIQFTIEEEENGCLPFLDTMLHREQQSIKFSVYRKNTNRDDFIHYLSGHSKRTKTGVVIGFYLRAIRICSREYLEDEFKYIKKAFRRLKYPEGLLNKLKKKAKEITERREDQQAERNNIRYLAAPHSNIAENIDRSLQKAGIFVASTAGTKIGEIVKKNHKEQIREEGIVYRIPCGTCPGQYFGESRKRVADRINEHRRDVRHHRTSNALVNHIDESGHLPSWTDVEVLHKGLSKTERKIIEAAYIITNQTINNREGFYKLSSVAGQKIISETKKKHINGQATGVSQSTTRAASSSQSGSRTEVSGGGANSNPD